MPAVSKAQQRFMGMVHAADKGETPASPEVAKVSADMKDSDAKDFASTKHAGLPDHVKEQLKSVVREVIREKNGMNEMSSNDVHFKHIMKMYDRGGSFTKKKIGAVVCKDPTASRKDVEEALFDADYRDIVEFEDELGLSEIREKYSAVNEEFKHTIHVDTPTQVVSKPVAAQIMALAKKGVRSNEIGLEMGFVGNQKMATDAFQKVKNQIYFALDKRNESVNEGSHGMATKLLQSIVSGDSSRAEGTKMSKELAQHYIDWIRTSPFGKKNGNLPLDMLVKASFNWGIERGLDSKLKGELSKLKSTIESVNELKKLPSGNFSIKVGYPTFADYEKKAKVGDTILKYDKRGGMIKNFVDGSELNQNAEKYLDKVNSITNGVVYLSKKGMKGVAQVPDYEKKEVGVLVLESKSINEAVDFRDGNYRFYSKDGVGYLTYNGKVLSSGDFDWEDGSNSYWMSHSSWGGQKAFDTGKDVIAYFKKNKIVNEDSHDCGCNENHDCGCGGVHEHTHIHEDLSADANGIAGLTASRANAVEDFLEKNNINSNKLYLFLKKGNLKDRMDFVTALVGKPGNPIQKKVIKQFSN